MYIHIVHIVRIFVINQSSINELQERKICFPSVQLHQLQCNNNNNQTMTKYLFNNKKNTLSLTGTMTK